MPFIIDHQVAAATLKITFGNGVGSSLLVQRGEQRFLMTAAHVCPAIAAGNRIGVSRNNDWNYVEVLGVQVCPMGSDVCVLRLRDGVGGGVEWDQIGGAGIIGEDVAYCGFPLSLQMLDVPDMDGFPHPIIKSGSISAFFRSDHGSEILIDTINNVGFSGGPVVKLDMATNIRRVIGLVSSYKFDAPSPLYKKLEDGSYEEVPDHFVQPNSGFMRAVFINQAKEAALMLV